MRGASRSVSGAGTPGVKDRLFRPVLRFAGCGHAARAIHATERGWKTHLLPGLLSWQKLSGLRISYPLSLLRLLRLRERHAATLLLQPRHELGVLQCLLQHALPVGVEVASGLVHQTTLVKPTH